MKFKVLSYIENYVYDGENIIDVSKLDLKSIYIINDSKSFFKTLLKNKIDLNFEKNIVDIEYFGLKLDNRDISSYSKIKQILKIQTQNSNRSIKYIPFQFVKKYLIEQYEKLNKNKIIVNEDKLKYIYYNNRIAKIFAEIELNKIKLNPIYVKLLQPNMETIKNEVELNSKLFGTITGRITNPFIFIKKNIRNKILKGNIYEFDFVAYEMINALNIVGYSISEDPYSIGNLDRDLVKRVFISKVFGAYDKTLYKMVNDNQNIDDILDVLYEKYGKLFVFREKLIKKVIKEKKILNPISGITIYYDNLSNKEIEKKVMNHYIQSISADILKIRIYTLYNYLKKHNILKKVQILCTINDSIVIKIEEEKYIDTIKDILTKEINIKKVKFKNKLIINKL